MGEGDKGQRTSLEPHAAGGWRAVLVAHALRLRSSIREGGAKSATVELPPSDMQILSDALGPMAQEALRIIETYTMGAVGSELPSERDEEAETSVPPEFNARLHIILRGFEPVGEPAVSTQQASGESIQSELWQLLYKVRESAELAYARELDLIELDRRIIFLLHSAGPLIPADISSAVGVDKAQVSRSVKRLIEIKMIERETLRSPLGLTRKGVDHGERLLRLADMRNRELTFDITDSELGQFFASVEMVLDQAVVLYEQEHRISQSSSSLELPQIGVAVESESSGGTGDRLVLDRARIISPLMTLSAYFSRSGALAFKRITALSNFEAWVLNEIGRDAPIDWSTLVNRLDRDHSQAGRTVKTLEERGLITREGKPGRRHGRFAPSPAGTALYEKIQELSHQRSNFLLAPLSNAERAQFMATVDKIRRNAVIQLEREKTFDELGLG